MSHAILVTRPGPQADELAAPLRAGGCTPVCVPTVAIDATAADPDLDAMLDSIETADWLVLTSANGAEALVARLTARRRHLPDGLRIAAVGPATALVLERASIPVHHTPDIYLTAAIADGLDDVRARRVVLARGEAATPELHEALVERGAIVEEVVAYRILEGPASSRDPLRAALSRELAGIAFTSGSTVRGLLRLASPLDRARARAIPAFCIGPVTAAEAYRSGFQIEAVAAVHTASGLSDAITDHFARGDQ